MNVAYKYNPRYTIADYRLWEGDWELIDGVAVAMTPSPSGDHQQMGMRLANAIFGQLEQNNCRDCFVYYELDWVVDDYTVVRPDLFIVCGAPVAQYLELPPALIVEISSPTTREKDRSVKWELYQAHRVPFYLIADPKTKSLEAFHLVGEHYQPQKPQEGFFRFELHAGCEIRLPSGTNAPALEF